MKEYGTIGSEVASRDHRIGRGASFRDKCYEGLVPRPLYSIRNDEAVLLRLHIISEVTNVPVWMVADTSTLAVDDNVVR